jgi:hypothetical protein
MGVMGTPTTRATNYLHARRLSDIVRSVVTQFGAHIMNRIALALVVAPLIVQIAALVARLI